MRPMHGSTPVPRGGASAAAAAAAIAHTGPQTHRDASAAAPSDPPAAHDGTRTPASSVSPRSSTASSSVADTDRDRDRTRPPGPGALGMGGRAHRVPAPFPYIPVGRIAPAGTDGAAVIAAAAADLGPYIELRNGLLALITATQTVLRQLVDDCAADPAGWAFPPEAVMPRYHATPSAAARGWAGSMDDAASQSDTRSHYGDGLSVTDPLGAMLSVNGGSLAPTPSRLPAPRGPSTHYSAHGETPTGPYGAHPQMPLTSAAWRHEIDGAVEPLHVLHVQVPGFPRSRSLRGTLSGAASVAGGSPVVHAASPLHVHPPLSGWELHSRHPDAHLPALASTSTSPSAAAAAVQLEINVTTPSQNHVYTPVHRGTPRSERPHPAASPSPSPSPAQPPPAATTPALPSHPHHGPLPSSTSPSPSPSPHPEFGRDPMVMAMLVDKMQEACQHLDRLQVRISDTRSSVLVTGDLNAGKSTFVNAILNREVVPDDQQPCTALFCEVKSVDQNDGVEEVHAIRDPEAYRRDDPTTFERLSLAHLRTVVEDNEPGYEMLKIYCRDAHGKSDSLLHNGALDISLIDSPGLNIDSMKTMALFAQQEEIDVIVFVVNAENHFTLSGREFLRTAGKEKAYLFIVVNRFDQIRRKDRCKRDVLDQIRDISPRTYAEAEHLVHFVSARKTLLSGLATLDAADDATDGGSATDGLARSPSPMARGAMLEPASEADLADFKHLERCLRQFILEKRARSKLAPAHVYLSHLLSDLRVLLAYNAQRSARALQRLDGQRSQNEARALQLAKLRETVLDRLDDTIADTAQRVADDAERHLNRFLDHLHHIPYDVTYHGMMYLWRYADDLYRAITMRMNGLAAHIQTEAIRLCLATGADIKHQTDPLWQQTLAGKPADRSGGSDRGGRATGGNAPVPAPAVDFAAIEHTFLHEMQGHAPLMGPASAAAAPPAAGASAASSVSTVVAPPSSVSSSATTLAVPPSATSRTTARSLQVASDGGRGRLKAGAIARSPSPQSRYEHRDTLGAGNVPALPELLDRAALARMARGLLPGLGALAVGLVGYARSLVAPMGAGAAASHALVTAAKRPNPLARGAFGTLAFAGTLMLFYVVADFRRPLEQQLCRAVGTHLRRTGWVRRHADATGRRAARALRQGLWRFQSDFARIQAEEAVLATQWSRERDACQQRGQRITAMTTRVAEITEQLEAINLDT